MSRRRRQQNQRNFSISTFLAPYLELAVYLALCLQIASTAIYYNPYLLPLVHKMLLGQMLALIAWLFFGFHAIAAKRLVFRKSPYYVPILVLCVWAGVRSITAPNADAVRNYWIFMNILCTFPLWVTGFRHRYVRSLFAYTVLFAGVVMALGCIRQMLVDDPRIDWPFFKAITLSPGSYDRQRLGSFMGHNNDSTAYLAIASIYAGLLWVQYRQKLWSVIFGVFILGAGAFIFLGGSRGVALMTLAALFVLATGWIVNRRFSAKGVPIPSLAFSRKWKIYGSVLLIALFILFAFLSTVPLEKKEIKGVWSRFLSPPEHLVSGTYPRVWLMSLLMAKDNPLMGVGFSSWPYRYPDYQKAWFTEYPDTKIGLPIIGQHTMRGHNDFLQLWAELGSIGLLCLFWLLWVHFRSFRKILISRNLSAFALFAFAATTATLMRAVFAFPFHMAASSCLFIANVALVSSIVYRDEWIWEPGELLNGAKAQWSAALGAVILFGVFSYPNWVMTVADFSSRLHGRKAEEAKIFIDYGDNASAFKSLDEGYGAMQHSLKVLSHQGKNLHEIGAETLQRAQDSKDEKQYLLAIDYLKQAEESYGFYRIHEKLGVAYRDLWEMTQKPEYCEEALKEFKEATAIMPTYATGYVMQALLSAKTGKQKECIDLLANTELRFPGFIERDLLTMAKAEKNIADKALLYDLAVSIVPSNENICREVLLFYLGIERLDRAALMFVQMAPYQPKQSVVDWMTLLLQTQLEHGHIQEAVDMMRRLRDMPASHSIQEILYYSGLIAWIGGYPEEGLNAWTYATEYGVNFQQLEKPLSVLLNHCLVPISLR